MNNQTRPLTVDQRAVLRCRSQRRVLLGGLGMGLGGLLGVLFGHSSILRSLSPGGLFTVMSVVWLGLWTWEPRLNPFALLWAGIQGLADGRDGWTQTQTITLRMIGRVAWDAVLVADDGMRYPLMDAIPPLAAGARLTLTISPRTRLVWAVTSEGGTR